MRVSNWYRWTRTKKRFAGICLLIGFLLAFTIETAPLSWGVVGIVFALVGVSILNTIHPDEW